MKAHILGAGQGSSLWRHAAELEVISEHPDIQESRSRHGVSHTHGGRCMHFVSTAATHEEQESRLANPEGWKARDVFQPLPNVVNGARGYASRMNLSDPHDGSVDFGRVMRSPDSVRRVGRAYDSLPMFDRNAVPSFEAMRNETNHQFDHAVNRMGIRPEFVDHDPYANVHDLVGDVAANKRLKVLRTAQTGGHPFFSDDENDKFRFVHDLFGHAGTGRGFDRHGEHAALLAHSRMFSPAARSALVPETMGQNSSLILNGEFGPQRIATLPPEMIHDNALRQGRRRTHFAIHLAAPQRSIQMPQQGASFGPPTLTPKPIDPPRGDMSQSINPLHDPADRLRVRPVMDSETGQPKVDENNKPVLKGAFDGRGKQVSFGMLVRNLKSHFDNASDEHHRLGRFWYKAAQDDINAVRHTSPDGTEFSLPRAIATASAFSPSTLWSDNMVFANNFMMNHISGDDHRHKFQMAHLHPAAVAQFRAENGGQDFDSEDPEHLHRLADLHDSLFGTKKAPKSPLQDPATRQEWMENIAHHGTEKVLADHEAQKFANKKKGYDPRDPMRFYGGDHGFATMGGNIGRAIQLKNSPDDVQQFADILGGPKTGNFQGNIGDETPIDDDGFYDLPINPKTGRPDWSKVDTGVTVDSHHFRASRMQHGDHQPMPFDPVGLSPTDHHTYDVFHRATLHATDKINREIQQAAAQNGTKPRYVTPKQVQAVIWLKHKEDRDRFGDRFEKKVSPEQRVELDQRLRVKQQEEQTKDEERRERMQRAIASRSPEDPGPSDNSPERPEQAYHELPLLWRRMMMQRKSQDWDALLSSWVEHYAPGKRGPQHPARMDAPTPSHDDDPWGGADPTIHHADVNINITDDGPSAGQSVPPQSQGPCGPGMFYDPAHGVCQPYPPAAPPPGYEGFGSSQNGFYDPTHGVTTSYPSSAPPAFYSTGSRDPWGGLVHTAVPENPSRRDKEKLMDHIVRQHDNGEDMGLTYHNELGDAPTSGTMVSYPSKDEGNMDNEGIPLDDLTADDLSGFAQRNRKQVNDDPNDYVGGWEHNNRWYNDVSHNHDDPWEAAGAALKNDQIGVYDLDGRWDPHGKPGEVMTTQFLNDQMAKGGSRWTAR